MANSGETAYQKVDDLIEQAKKIQAAEPDKANALAAQAMQLSIDCGYKLGEATALAAIAFGQRVKGNFVESLELYQQARHFFESMGLKERLAAVYNNMGINHASMGNFSEALESYHTALSLHEELGNKTGIARLSNNIGSVYDNIGDSDKALEQFGMALAINRELGNIELIAKNYTNIGVVNRNLKHYSEALSYFEKAAAIHESRNDKVDLALNYGNMGVVCEEMGDYALAFKHASLALTISNELEDKDMIAFNSCTAGNALVGLQRYEEAFLYLSKALQVAKQINSLKWQQISYEYLANYHQILNQWKEALENYKLADGVKSALKKEDVRRKAITMEMQKKLSAEEAVRKTTEKILYNILPQAIAERIKTGDEEIIERYENCSVLFADIVGFTTWSAGMEVKELARHLNKLFQIFDDLANQYGVEKIKTIGDAYMCVAGLPEPCIDHAERIAHMALAMQSSIAQAYPQDNIRLRIGIHCGEVIAGVLGKNKYAYDLWGDTVNTASRMESHSIEDKIQVSEAFRNLIAHKFSLQERGEIDIKGKGKMRTWFLIQ